MFLRKLMKRQKKLTYLLTYLLTYSLTPWCRVLFEKLIVIQLVKKYPAFSMEPESSLPCLQKPATGPYPEPSKSSSPHRSLPLLGRAKNSVQLRGALKHFITIKMFTVRCYQPHSQPPSCITTPCRLSATAYSIYS
jgi:hypothetical protein